MDEESFINLLGVDYKREGRLFKITCPFHHDTHPSLVVYPQDRGYCCYPCGRTGSWQELYKEIKGCDWKEAYEVLEIDGDYHTEKKPTIRFDFVDSETPEIIKAVQERYAQCLDLDSPKAAPMVEWLKRKHLLDEAREQGWRWDIGVFKQSRPFGAVVIPYREEGQIVSCRLRPLTKEGFIDKPKTLSGTHSRPYVLIRERAKDVYLCEGETDALTLYGQGCSVVAVPGAMQKRCINTAILWACLSDAERIISCGDNDGPGANMNDWAKKAARHLATCEFAILPSEVFCEMNDLNDVYVAGKLNLHPNPIQEIFPGATPLTGWDETFALTVFSDREESKQLIKDQLKTIPPEDKPKLKGLITNDLQRMQETWATLPPELQHKYEGLKDAMKLLQEKV